MRPIEYFPKIFLHRMSVDMRKGAIGLMMIVKESMHLDPFSPHLYAFCNQRRDLMKLVYWDKTGMAMWVKRLDQEKFPWPRKFEQSTIEITPTQMNWLLEGFDFWKLKPHKNLEYTQFY